MQHWQDPRPLFPWSPRPEPRRNAAPRLRPNIYARVARFAVQNPGALIWLTLFFLAAALTFAAFNAGPDNEEAGSIANGGNGPSIESLKGEFPAAGMAVVVRIGGNDPKAAKVAASEIAAQIASDKSVFEAVYVPGIGPFYERYGVYYLDVATVAEQVDRVRLARPWIAALSSSPSLLGLIDLVADAGAREGDAASLAPLFMALSRAVGDVEQGGRAGMDWTQAVGLDLSLESRTWAIVILPKTGATAEARRRIEDAIARVQAQTSSLTIAIETEDGATARAASPGVRQLAVCCFLAMLFLATLLTMMTGGLRNALLVITPALVAAVAGLAAASVLLDGSARAVAPAVVAIALPCIAAASLLATALSHHEPQASSRQSLIMLAAQQAGPIAAAVFGLAAVTWLAWSAAGLELQNHTAEVVIFGLGCGSLGCFLLLPCLARVLPVPARKDGGEPRTLGFGTLERRLRAPVSMALLAISFASALAFASTETAVSMIGPADALHVIASGRAEAERIADAIGKLPLAQNPHWVQSMLPADVTQKQAELLRLRNMAGPVASSQVLAGPYGPALQKLTKLLTGLAAAQDDANAVKSAASELSRSITLLIDATDDPEKAGQLFERLAFARLPELQPRLDSLAALPAPGEKDLDSGLRTLFVSATGAYRIEVRPNALVPAPDFLASLRGIAPDVRGAAVTEADEASKSLLGASTAMMAAISAILLLGFTILRDLPRWLTFAAAQIASIGLFAGCLLLTGRGLGHDQATAITTALTLSASSAFISAAQGVLPWASPQNMLLAPLAGIALVSPALILRLDGIAGAAALALFLCMANVCAHLILVPQLAQWIGSRRGGTALPAAQTPFKQTGDKP